MQATFTSQLDNNLIYEGQFCEALNIKEFHKLNSHIDNLWIVPSYRL